MSNSKGFYSELARFYPLIYADWEASVRRQSAQLSSVLTEKWRGVKSILDVSCGIGTQSLGLAELGYQVTGSDLSPEAIERANAEAERRNLSIEFSVADMRGAFRHHGAPFDLVLSGDNSVPHLLSNSEILTAFREFYSCLRSGGGCLISVRDYEAEDLSERQVKPYGVRDREGARWLIWQVWEPRDRTYDLAMYFVEDRGGNECKTHVMRCRYYPVGIQRLIELMTEAGFVEVERLDGRFFQPLILGTKR